MTDGSAAPRHARHYGPARRRMTERLAAMGITDARVLEAMSRVPRHLFGAPGLEGQAYEESALPLGHGQTLSSPLTVARMTQALELTGEEKALEIGTGSGYQTAVLAELCGPIFTVERIEALSTGARQLLAELGAARVNYKVGDGTLGWRDFAPFHAILVTAASPEVPAPLLEQLAPGGRLVAPVGGREEQMIVRVRRDGERWTTVSLGECSFVPLIGRAGWKSG